MSTGEYNRDLAALKITEKKHWLNRDWNDRVSAVAVRPGCVLSLKWHTTDWEHTQEQKRQPKIITGPQRIHMFRDGWDNEVSSWACECVTRDAYECKPADR